MIFSKLNHCGWLLAVVAALSLALTATVGQAQTYLTIDGRDVANLAGDGNHGTFHNPPVNFAFVFDDSANTPGFFIADNPDAGPGDPPTDTETMFDFNANIFGGLGFGTAASGNGLDFPAPAAFEIDLEVNAGNTLPAIFLNLKDRDNTGLGTGVEELQYSVPLPAAGSGPQTVVVPLATPVGVNGAIDSTPNFDPGNLGLEELQLQYPFNDNGSGLVLDIKVSELRIVGIPEPSALALVGLCSMLLGSFGIRRR